MHDKFEFRIVKNYQIVKCDLNFTGILHRTERVRILNLNILVVRILECLTLMFFKLLYPSEWARIVINMLVRDVDENDLKAFDNMYQYTCDNIMKDRQTAVLMSFEFVAYTLLTLFWTSFWEFRIFYIFVQLFFSFAFQAFIKFVHLLFTTIFIYICLSHNV